MSSIDGRAKCSLLRIRALDINPLPEQINIQKGTRQGTTLSPVSEQWLRTDGHNANRTATQWHWYKLGAQSQQALLELFRANLYFIMTEGQLSTSEAGSQPAPL